MPSHSYTRSPHWNSPPVPVPNPPTDSSSSFSSPTDTPLPLSAGSNCPLEAWPVPLTCRRNLTSTPRSAPKELQPRWPPQASPSSLPAQGGGVSSATTSATLAFLTKGSSSELRSLSKVLSAFSFPFLLLFLFLPEPFPAQPHCAIEHRTLRSWHQMHTPRSMSPYLSMTW